jgi:DNA polymerase-3 subunit delta'
MSVWDQFIGHPRPRKMLESAARRPIGTYLFVGSAGVGKRNAARVMSAALICPEACGECNACSRVMRDLHPDVSVLQPEGYSHPVEALRAAAAAASQTPLEAAHRVFIVEEADRIPERSQNALLKALEEPSRSAIWILLAETVEPFLPTILSRCHVVDFPPVAEEALSELLQSRFGMGHEEAIRHVRASRGDLDAAVRLAGEAHCRELRRRAFRLCTAPRISGAALLREAEAVKQLASVYREEAEQAFSAELAHFEEVAGTQPAAIKKRIADRNKRVLRRVETEVYVDYLSWLGGAFRDLAAASAGGDAGALVAHDFTDELLEAGAAQPTGFWIDMVEHCLEGQLAIRENANPMLVTESILLRLAS